MRAIRSAFTWMAMIGIIALMLPTLALVRLFDRSPIHYRTGRTFRRMGSWMTRVNPAWRIQISGDFPKDPRNPYVVVSNHQSNADVPLVSRLPWEMKWIGKKELFDIPIVGWLMKLSDDIEVDRKDPRSRASVLTRAKDVLDQRCSVMFFPEGTRSKDGRVKAFYDGAFRLAIKAQVPILPVALDGTTDALPKHDWKFGKPSEVYLKVLPAIPTKGLTKDDVSALRDRVRTMIVEQIATWRGESVEAVSAPPKDVLPETEALEEVAKTGV
ncbi:MAG: lysophospholipid acyltransferase family protein [Bacteroidota bacterium]